MSESKTKLTAEDAARIARLARLDPPQDKLELFAQQFNDILGHMETLGEVDTSGVEPLYSPVSHGTVFREDVVEKRVSRDQVLDNAPEADGQFFIVPKIV